jgi:hypothetical protein
MKTLCIRLIVHNTILVFLVLAMMACDSNETPNEKTLHAQSRTSALNSTQMFILTQEVLDISAEILYSEGVSIDGQTGSPDDCTPSTTRQYLADYTHYDSTIYCGRVTQVYDTKCSQESMRTGSLSDFFTYIINYQDEISFSVKQMVTLKGLMHDGISMDGELHLTAESGVSDTAKFNSLAVTFGGGERSILTGMLISKRIRSSSSDDYTQSITGELTGTSQDNLLYNSIIERPILYRYDCEDGGSLIPVSGVVQLRIGIQRATIDYGTGKCDRTYTVKIGQSIVTYSF